MLYLNPIPSLAFANPDQPSYDSDARRRRNYAVPSMPGSEAVWCSRTKEVCRVNKATHEKNRAILLTVEKVLSVDCSLSAIFQKLFIIGELNVIIHRMWFITLLDVRFV